MDEEEELSKAEDVPAVMREFFETTRYDETGDWRKKPQTEPPDD